MKTIKFRAWGKQINYDVPRRENGCADWVVYMCYSPNIYNGYNSDEAADINDGIKEEQEDGVIFMQYFNYKDKNGKEVYEGDILKINRYNGLNGNKFIEITEAPSKVNEDVITMVEDFEVIGNIYENPELLDIG